MDVTEKISLVSKPPTEEVVTQEELLELFKTNSKPKHYIGIEISGFLHLGSLISTGFKINDFVKAGVDCTVFLADWHTLLNEKMGGNFETIRKVSKYYEDAFRLVCPEANVVLGTDLYDSKKEYWSELVQITKHMTLARTKKTLTIMGRKEGDEKIDLGHLLYPAMQAADIHSLDLDIVHAGMDQRKIHMLVKDVFPKMKWKVPVAVHHKLLPGLTKPVELGNLTTGWNPGGEFTKMSKSDPNAGIFIHNSDDEIRTKIKKGFCDEGIIENNPILEIAKHVVFHEFDALSIERPEKFGGNVSYDNFESLESDFSQKKLHPADLKQAIGESLVKIVSPVREKLALGNDLSDLIKNSY
jgi:tyrosyl-tRNA synthetase